jgi:hypothetical protein
MGTSLPTSLTNNRLLWLAVFGIAMGLLEAIVVVYLRELYFPGGFRFPLRFIPAQMLRMEILRELATLAMLLSVAMAAAEGFRLRFAVFLFTFGIWDLCYYGFLKVLLDWPPSFLTWDVLFLIPLTWLGPVLAPVICAATMIGLAVLWILLHRRPGSVAIGRAAWLLLGAGAALIFVTFIKDAAGIIIEGGFLTDLAGLTGNRDFQAAMAAFVPTRYDWPLFSIGEALVLLAGVAVYRRNAGTEMATGQARAGSGRGLWKKGKGGRMAAL